MNIAAIIMQIICLVLMIYYINSIRLKKKKIRIKWGWEHKKENPKVYHFTLVLYIFFILLYLFGIIILFSAY
jgi:ABC-type Fe3+ transport system permease subunit